MGLFSRFRKNTPRPGSAEETMADAASDLVEAFTGEGSPVGPGELDFTRASLSVVDRVLGEFHEQQAPLPFDLHFMLSAYVFEVARREFGGRYQQTGDDEASQFVLVIGEPEFSVGVMVMDKVTGRASNGEEDSIRFFYDGIDAALERKVNATLI